MASSARTITALARARPASALLRTSQFPSATPLAFFSTTAARPATPAGPPPSNFRLPKAKRWDDNSESTLDKAGKYFLMTEMLRGMYVVLEQFFRPP